MRKNNPNRLHRDSDHRATGENNSFLLRKFKCFPCFVKLIRTGMSPKKDITQKIAEKSNIITRAGRITNRRVTIDSHVLDRKMIPEIAAKKVTRRRSSTTGTCSKQIVTGT